jgi:hypothetical protein
VTCDASLDDVRPGDLLRLDFGEAEDAKETRRLIARDWLLEVTRVTNDDDHSVVHGLCRGRAFTVDAATMRMTPAPEPSQPDLASEPWVKRAYPEWYNLLQDLADEGRYPAPSAASIASAIPNEGVAVDVTKLTSYDELKGDGRVRCIVLARWNPAQRAAHDRRAARHAQRGRTARDTRG